MTDKNLVTIVQSAPTKKEAIQKVKDTLPEYAQGAKIQNQKLKNGWYSAYTRYEAQQQQRGAGAAPSALEKKFYI